MKADLYKYIMKYIFIIYLFGVIDVVTLFFPIKLIKMKTI
jgi:glycopeptide antibiotics resistance protein